MARIPDPRSLRRIALGMGAALALTATACKPEPTAGPRPPPPASPAASGPTPAAALPRIEMPAGEIVGRDCNVLLISLDTTRADRLGCYGHRSAQTPNIDRLAAGGTRFAHCYAQVPLTLPSHSSLFTATAPYRHGVRDNLSFVLAQTEATLAEALRAAGYATGAEVAAAVLNREFGLSQGFDHYGDVSATRTWRDQLISESSERRVEWPADVVTESAIRWLRAADEKKFFLWVHYFDPHTPYEPPPEFSSAASPYDGEIAFVDQQIGRLLAVLDELKRTHETLVVLLGDHGEALGEHGEVTHGYYVYDSTLHVPLILSYPSLVPAGKVVDATVRLIDVAPTILEFAGLPPLPGAEGVSLLAYLAGRATDVHLPVYSESMYPKLTVGCSPLRALRHEGWKLIYAPTPELYHVASDRGEAHDQAASEPQRVAAMVAQLRSMVEGSGDLGGAAASAIAADPTNVGHLAGLGYLGGTSGEDDENLFAFEPAGPDPRSCADEFAALDRAVTELTSGDPAVALQSLKGALGKAARPEALFLAHKTAAEALVALGRPTEALAHFSAALQIRPSDVLVRASYARALVQSGQREEALREFEMAVAAGPALVPVLYEYSVALGRSGRLSESLAQAQRALQTDPTFAPAKVQIGRVLVQLGLLEDGLAALREAAAIVPEDPHFGALVADVLIEQGRAEDGLREYRELRQRFPGSGLVLGGLGRAERALRRYDAARETLQQGIQADPKHAPLWIELAQVYLDQRDYAKALETLRAAREAIPTHPRILTALAWLLATTPLDGERDVRQAGELAEQLARRDNGRNARVLDALAAALAGAGEFTKAREVLTRAITLTERAGDRAYTAELRDRLRLYEGGRAFRLPN